MPTGRREEGFTIIEVLIVLAIAGLIMVIVFLAVPALQRNSRNTQRQNDASRIVAAINECTNNKNGQLTSCNDAEAASLNEYITISENQQLTGWGEATLDGVIFNTNTKCNSAGGGVRAFTLQFKVETQGGGEANRCIDS